MEKPRWIIVLLVKDGQTIRLGRIFETQLTVTQAAVSIGRRVSWEHAQGDSVATWF